MIAHSTAAAQVRSIRARLPALLTLAAALLVFAVAPASAQDAAAPPDAISVEELERLVQTLEDEPARQRLVAELRALIAAQRAQAPPPEATEPLVERLGQALSERWALLRAHFASREGLLALAWAGLLSLVVIAIALGVARLLRRLVERALRLDEAHAQRSPRLQARLNRYRPVLVLLVRLAVAVVAAALVLAAWGVPTLAMLEVDWARRVVSAAISILLVVAFAVAVWELVSWPMERYLLPPEQGGDEREPSRRARTLLPLARIVLMIVLTAVVALTVLAELGVNIAPLLAGAGVVGLAVGFGAQKLVQDIITGAFILFEETLDVGDVVTAGGHTGVVEGLTLRTIRMRDLHGNVHTVPFSAVDTVVNMTKDFSHAMLEVGVAYREDTDAVVAVLCDICEEMRADGDWAPAILEPLEVLGLDRFEDSAVIVRVRIKTPPGKQWSVAREFNRRMKRRFDELGIEIPFPHRTIYFGEDKAGGAPPARVRVQPADSGA